MSAPVLAPNAPKRYPLVGHLIQLSRDPLGFLSTCSQTYGEIIPLQCAHKSGVFINKPDYVELVLKNPQTFVKSRAYLVMKSFIGEGLITSEGSYWSQQRHTVQPVFQHQRIPQYADVMVEVTRDFLASLQSGEQRNIHADMMNVTLDIVMKCIFSEDISEQDSLKISQALAIAHRWFEQRQRMGFFLINFLDSTESQYKQSLQQMDAIIYRIIRARRHHPAANQSDLLSMMIQAGSEDNDGSMTDLQLRDEIATLMLAGHETTAATLSWVWMLLANHPDKLCKLEQEVDTVLAGKLPGFEDLPNLNYTTWVVKEAMRLYPPVSIMGRVCTTDTLIGNHLIPQGHFVLLSQWVMHRHPDYFDAPEQFMPERWQNDLEKQLPKGVYFPFSDGPRVCIGKGFALMETVLVLATIAQKFRLSLVEGQTITPKQSFTLRPSAAVQVVMTTR